MNADVVFHAFNIFNRVQVDFSNPVFRMHIQAFTCIIQFSLYGSYIDKTQAKNGWRVWRYKRCWESRPVHGHSETIDFHIPKDMGLVILVHLDHPK